MAEDNIRPLIGAAKTVATGLENWLIARTIGATELAGSILEVSLASGFIAMAAYSQGREPNEATLHATKQLNQLLEALLKTARELFNRRVSGGISDKKTPKSRGNPDRKS